MCRSSCRPIAEQRVVFCLARHFPLALFRDFSFIKSVSTEKWKSCISGPRCPQQASSIEGTSIAGLHDPWQGAASRQTQEPCHQGAHSALGTLACPHPPSTLGLLQPLRPSCKLLVFPFTSARCTKKSRLFSLPNLALFRHQNRQE